MSYTQFFLNLSNAINKQFEEISAQHNFDYGDEFEVAICELLNRLLPSKFGVCRGFAVTERDQRAGDDILIYDKDRFPTLRLLDHHDYSRKEDIPIEAVYAYIEAKHTLILEKHDSGQSLFKALQQVGDVKKLPRVKRSLVAIDPYMNLGSAAHAERPNWPDHTNPLYGAVVSRYVKRKTSGSKMEAGEIVELIPKLNIPRIYPEPDLLVLGDKTIVFPVTLQGEERVYDSPFFVEGLSSLAYREEQNSALALGVVMLLYALDTIRLDKMPFRKMVASRVAHDIRRP